MVLLRRNPGEGDFVGMNFIFSDGENTEIIKLPILLLIGQIIQINKTNLSFQRTK